MLTATEIVFIKDLIAEMQEFIEEESGVSGNCFKKESDIALEFLNKIEPIETESVLDLLDSYEDENGNEYN